MTETKATFDEDMYPEGVNNNFLTKSEEELAETFGNSNGKGKFEDPETRDIAKNKLRVLDLLKRKCQLKQGSVVADVGAGTGLFVSDLAKVVGPSGKVLALDISPGFVSMMKKKVETEGLGEVVEVCLSEDKRLGLGEEMRVDVVLVCDVYHHFEYPLTLMKDIRDKLADNGRLCVIDFHRDSSKIWSHPKGWAEQHLRAGQATFRNEILQCGFELVEEPVIKELTENYIMLFKKT